ncbi:MAG: CRISPR-associated CARF protein Csx1 [Candidatus Thermoplasmatota archaeon]|nr:CRISPR-associated CARF protein Csx1 [Candidatus Thermoplasmatota archaeon]
MILIAPWGDPTKWESVKYVVEGVKEEACTSLVPLKKLLNPEKILIIALDSLAEGGEDYKEVKRNAEEKVRRCAEGFGLNNFDIIIGPSKGSFSTGMTFDGEMMDFYYYTLAELALYLMDHSSDEIALDVTHGINFETVLTYRALRDILAMVSFFKETNLRVYNSDPYINDTTKELLINEIENTKVSARLPDAKMQGKLLLKGRGLSNEECRKLSKEQEINGEISAFIGSFYNALPLALCTFAQDPEELRRLIERVLSLYDECVEVKGKTVCRKTRFSGDLYPCVAACVLAFYGNMERREEVPLRDIEKIAEIFKRDERFKVRIGKEIEEIKNVCESRIIPEWTSYNWIYAEKIAEKKAIPVSNKRDKRNFLAHSGFERNSVEIKKDEEIMLRYSKDSLKDVKNYALSGLSYQEYKHG